MENQTLRNQTNFSETELDRRTQFDRSRPVERDEDDNLIASAKVKGTKVYSTDGEELGEIDHMMIGKRSGRVEYTVMSFGGFLGMNESHFPIPWDALDYDTERGGYVVNIDKERLKDAPKFDRGLAPDYGARNGQAIYAHYGVMY